MVSAICVSEIILVCLFLFDLVCLRVSIPTICKSSYLSCFYPCTCSCFIEIGSRSGELSPAVSLLAKEVQGNYLVELLELSVLY